MLTRQAHPQLLSNLPVCQTTVNTTEAPWGCLGQSQIPSNSCSMTSTIIQTAAISATVVAAREKFPFFLIAKHRVFNVEKMQFHKNWCAGYHLHFIPCPTCWCKGGFQYNSWEGSKANTSISHVLERCSWQASHPWSLQSNIHHRSGVSRGRISIYYNYIYLSYSSLCKFHQEPRLQTSHLLKYLPKVG